MARPSKPASVIKLEGKSHRTKKELRNREQAENSLLSGMKLKESEEVKNNPKAHQEDASCYELRKNKRKTSIFQFARVPARGSK